MSALVNQISSFLNNIKTSCDFDPKAFATSSFNANLRETLPVDTDLNESKSVSTLSKEEKEIVREVRRLERLQKEEDRRLNKEKREAERFLRLEEKRLKIEEKRLQRECIQEERRQKKRREEERRLQKVKQEEEKKAYKQKIEEEKERERQEREKEVTQLKKHKEKQQQAFKEFFGPIPALCNREEARVPARTPLTPFEEYCPAWIPLKNYTLASAQRREISPDLIKMVDAALEAPPDTWPAMVLRSLLKERRPCFSWKLRCSEIARTRKYLIFHESLRPACNGPLQLRSLTIGPRRPFRRDDAVRDYDCDSEEDWEYGDLEAVTSGEDDEEDEKEADEADEFNGFVVPHGYLSEDEKSGSGLDEPHANEQDLEKTGGCIRGAPLVFGCVWDISLLDGPAAALAASCAVVPFEQTPIRLTGGDIGLEDGLKKKKRLAALEGPPLQELARIIHGSGEAKKALVERFLQEQVHLSKGTVLKAIKDIATHKFGLWQVKDELLDAFNLQSLSPPKFALPVNLSVSPCTSATPKRKHSHVSNHVTSSFKRPRGIEEDGLRKRSLKGLTLESFFRPLQSKEEDSSDAEMLLETETGAHLLNNCHVNSAS